MDDILLYYVKSCCVFRNIYLHVYKTIRTQRPLYRTHFIIPTSQFMAFISSLQIKNFRNPILVNVYNGNYGKK